MGILVTWLGASDMLLSGLISNPIDPSVAWNGSVAFSWRRSKVTDFVGSDILRDGGWELKS